MQGTIHDLYGRAPQAASALLSVAGEPPASYALLRETVAQAGRVLRGRGVARDDRVAMILPAGPIAASCFLAVADVAIAAPLNPAFAAHELDFYLGDLRPRALVVPADGYPAAEEVALSLGIEVVHLRATAGGATGAFELDGDPVPASAGREPRPRDIALVLHTSGTTSRPKTVPLTHANLCASAEHVAVTLALSAADKCLNVMPLFHIHGLVAALLASLARGAGVVCPPGFDATRFTSQLVGSSATWYTAVPTMHLAVLDRIAARPTSIDGHALRFVRSSSAALPVTAIDRLQAAFGVPVIEAYGMTEAAHQMCSNPLPPAVRKPGSVGPAAGPTVSVLDPSGHVVPAGDVGEVAIRGANVIAGYSDPEQTAAASSGEWFLTGDLGRMDGDGYLFLTGRKKEIINRGGETIAPREIDEAVASHQGVAMAVAFAVPDERLGEDIGVAVVRRPGSEVDAVAIRRHVAARLSATKVPRIVRFVDELPKGPTGKLQRIGLADVLGITAAGTEARAPSRPATPAEARMAALWCRELAVERVLPSDDFFAVGGDSALAARVLAAVESEFGAELRMLAFFEAPRLSEFTALVEQAQQAGLPARTPVAVRQRRFALTAGERRMWLHARMFPRSRAYHYVRAADIEGPLDDSLLRAALLAVVDRHERLRTVFDTERGQPVAHTRASIELDWSVTDLASLDPVSQAARAVEIQRQLNDRPYDLANGPLIRGHLLRLAPERHRLLVPIHHIAFDGSCLPVLWHDLSVAYAALVAGETPPPRLPPCMSEVVEEIESRLTASERARQRAHWQRVFATPIAFPQLATDRDRPAVATEAGAQVEGVIASEVAAGLRSYAAAAGTTRYRVALAAFFAWLYRCTGESDLVVGTQTHGRSVPRAEQVVGMFTNTVPIRVRVDGGMSFADLVARTRDVTGHAYAASDISFEEIVRVAGQASGSHRARLFSTAFQLRSWEDRFSVEGGPRFIDREIDDGVVRAELEFLLVDAGDQVQPHVKYRRDLFHRETIEQFIAQYSALLASALETPGSAIERLSWREVARSVVPAVRGADDAGTVHGAFAGVVRRTPDALALDCEGSRWTYEELDRRATAIAGELVRRGVARGAVVGLSVPRSNDLVAAMLGILKAGAAYLPLAIDGPPLQRHRALAETRAAVVVTAADDGEWPAAVSVVDLGRVTAAAEVVCRGGSQDACYVIYTSGSTGVPKGVVVEHRNVMHHASATASLFRLTEADRVLLFSPVTFDMAVEQIFPTLLAGGTIVVEPNRPLASPAAFVASLAARRVSVLNLPTSYWHMLTRTAGDELRHLPPCLRLVIVGGEAAGPESYRRWHNTVAHRVQWLNTYGPTEGTVTATWFDPQLDPRPWRDDGRLPIGRPLTGVGVEVCDGAGTVLPLCLPGELHLTGAGVARGYVVASEESPFSTSSGGARRYRTGDRVRMRCDGHLEFLGRFDRQVKLHGYRVEPFEIEQALSEHSSVRQAVVVVAAAADGEARIVAYVAAREQPPSPQDLRQFLLERIPAFMVPADVVVLEQLPMLASGKVDREALPAPLAADLAAGDVPATEAEVAIASVWAEIFGRDRIGLGDDFFALGGDSLRAVEMLARLERRFWRPMPVATLFEAPTVRELAARYDRSVRVESTGRPIAIRSGGGGAPLFCLPGAGGTVLTFASLADGLPAGRAIFGLQYPGIDGEAAPCTRVDAVARALLGQVLDVSQGGAHCLLGYSFGGLVAHELACQLVERGERVAALVLVDTAATLPVVSGAKRLRWRAGELVGAPARGQVEWLENVERALHDATVFSSVRRLVAAAQQARSLWRPRRFPGRVVLLRGHHEVGADFGEDGGWRRHADEVVVREVPGVHRDLFAPHVVPRLAQLITGVFA